MPKGFDDLRLKHMDTRLAGWRRLRGETPPRGGWLRAIRTALGISTGQLARRLGVAQQAIVKFEQNEAASKITLDSLERVAKALGCRVVYAVVPEKPLGVVRRARALASFRGRLGSGARQHPSGTTPAAVATVPPASRRGGARGRRT